MAPFYHNSVINTVATSTKRGVRSPNSVTAMPVATGPVYPPMLLGGLAVPLATFPPSPGPSAEGVLSISVLLPTIYAVAEEARLNVVPIMVITGPPGLSVCEETIYSPSLFAAIVEPPTVRGGSSGDVAVTCGERR